MTCAARLTRNALAVRAAPNEVDMRMAIVPLSRKIRLRVTVEAAGMAKNRGDPGEGFEAAPSLGRDDRSRARLWPEIGRGEKKESRRGQHEEGSESRRLCGVLTHRTPARSRA